MKTSFKSIPSLLAFVAALALLVGTPPMRAQAAEHSLGGVRIFSPIDIVLRRFGGPTFITAGNQPATVLFTYGRPTLVNPADSGMAAGPGMMGAGMPGFGKMPGGMSGGNPYNTDMAQSTSSQSDPFNPTYDGASRYYYDLPQKGLVYEFVATAAGRVVEIKVYGYQGSVKTSQGIVLGSNYAQIGLKYGYPEQTISQIQSPDTPLTLIYSEKSHVAFQLIRNKVAVISVVAPD